MTSNYELELQIEQSNDLKNKVVKLTAEGRKPSEISRITGLSLREQREINEEFRELARNSTYVQRRSKEIIAYGDVHFGSIIDRLNEVEESAKLNGDDKLRADTLSKLIVAEAKRIEFLQKAGIINDQGIGAEVARVEAKQEQIIGILQEARAKFPQAAKWIGEQLQKLNGLTPSERAD